MTTTASGGGPPPDTARGTMTDLIAAGPVGRVDEYDSRYYVDPADPDLIYTSVTTILGATESKPWLAPWSAKLAAEFSVDHYDLVTRTANEVGRDAAIDLIKNEAKRLRAIKREIGTYQHDVLEAFLIDAPFPDVPEHLVDVEVDGERVDLDAISDGLVNFLTDFQISPRDIVLAEATVANVMHAVAGTLDTLLRFPTLPGRPLGLIDCKTGTRLDPSINAQLGAYRRADEIWVDHMGSKYRMPQVDFCAVLHIRREYDRGYKLIKVPADQGAWDWFLARKASFEFADEQPKIKGRPLYPPLPDGSQPPPLLEDLDHPGLGRCVKPLKAAGIHSLTDLAELTVVRLLETSGIGPKSAEALKKLLADHGLQLSNGRKAA